MELSSGDCCFVRFKTMLTVGSISNVNEDADEW